MSADLAPPRVLLSHSVVVTLKRPGLWPWGALALAPVLLLLGLSGDPGAVPGAALVAQVLPVHRIAVLEAAIFGAVTAVLVLLLVLLARAALNVLQGRGAGVREVLHAIRPRWSAILVFVALFGAGTCAIRWALRVWPRLPGGLLLLALWLVA